MRPEIEAQIEAYVQTGQAPSEGLIYTLAVDPRMDDYFTTAELQELSVRISYNVPREAWGGMDVVARWVFTGGLDGADLRSKLFSPDEITAQPTRKSLGSVSLTANSQPR